MSAKQPVQSLNRLQPPVLNSLFTPSNAHDGNCLQSNYIRSINWDWFHLNERCTDTCHWVHSWIGAKRTKHFQAILSFFWLLVIWQSCLICWIPILTKLFETYCSCSRKVFEVPQRSVLRTCDWRAASEIPQLSSIILSLSKIFFISNFKPSISVQFYRNNQVWTGNPVVWIFH